MKNTTVPKHATYWIETYGCQMNTAESNALEQALQAAGLRPANSALEADCAILNTCSVRKTAENRIWGRIGFFQHVKQHRPLTLMVTGCMAERLGDQLMQDAPAVDHVLGTNDKQRIAAILSGASDEREPNYQFTQSYYKEGQFSSFVPIMNGCNNFCAYCIVPYVRGREVSRDPQSIYDEVSRLESLQVKQITLLGQNVNSYQYQSGHEIIRFPELLSHIASKCSTIRWIRFESPHPKDFSPELVDLIGKEPKIARHLHIPLQSGSTKILGLMNRRYTAESFIRLIGDLRASDPSLTFTTDVMVGFPQETEEDFNETLALMKEVRFLEAFMYYFNPREGTKAVELAGQIPADIRLERLSRLIEFQRKITAEEKQKRVGSIADVLVEQPSRRDPSSYLARTEQNDMVVFDQKGSVRPGEIVRLKLTGLKGSTFVGRFLEE